jgi:hypothetical protein
MLAFSRRDHGAVLSFYGLAPTGKAAGGAAAHAA